MEIIYIFLIDVVDKLNTSRSERHQVADFWRAETSMTLHSIQLTYVMRVEFVDVLPLIKLIENIEPRARESDW